MTTQATIFISAYRNSSIRYILYSDIFNELRASGFRLVVFVKDNDVQYYREAFKDENVVVEPVLYDAAMREVRSNQLSRWFVLLRKCMSGRDKGFENKTDQVRVEIYRRHYSGTWKAMLVHRSATLLAALGSRVKLVRRALANVESRLFPGQMYNGLFQRYNPQLLIVGSLGYMIDPLLMRAAKRHGCTIVSIPHSWDNTSTKDYRGGDPDHVIAWNEPMKREVEVFHDVPRGRVFVGGIAHWDFYFNGRLKPTPRDEFLSANGLSNDRKIIFYGTSSHRMFTRTFDVIEELLQAMEQDAFSHPSQLLVRLHPGYLLPSRGGEGQIVDGFQDRIAAIKKRYGALVSFADPVMRVLNDDIDMPVEDMHRLADALCHSDVLLTEYSTLMIEGAIFDLPVVNVGLYNFRDGERPLSYVENFTHLRRVLKAQSTRNAYSFEQLVEHINFYLEDPSRDGDARKRLIAQEVTTSPGCAGKSIGVYISNLAKQRVSQAES